MTKHSYKSIKYILYKTKNQLLNFTPLNRHFYSASVIFTKKTKCWKRNLYAKINYNYDYSTEIIIIIVSSLLWVFSSGLKKLGKWIIWRGWNAIREDNQWKYFGWSYNENDKRDSISDITGGSLLIYHYFLDRFLQAR